MLTGERLLTADIGAWQYRVSLAAKEAPLTGRRLLLVGVTRASGFLPRIELNLEIDEAAREPQYPEIASADGTGVKLGEMVFHGPLAENDLPAFVHGSVTISPDRFDAVLDMLRCQSRSRAMSLQVASALYGLDIGGEGDADRWPAGKTIFVTDQKFTLVNSPVEKTPDD